MPLVDRDGTRIRYEVDGDGEPALLHHGFSDGAEAWVEQGWVERLAPAFRLIRVDARGHGLSSKPHDPGAYAMRERVEDLLAVLDDLGVESAHYVGYSLGGRVGFELGGAAPERVRSLALGGAHPYAQSMEPYRRGIAGGIEPWVRLLEQAGRFGAFTRERLLANDPEALAASVAADRPDRSEILERIESPSLLFVGADDPVRPQVEEVAAALSGAELRILEGHDHLSLGTSLARALPVVEAFLRSLTTR